MPVLRLRRLSTVYPVRSVARVGPGNHSRRLSTARQSSANILGRVQVGTQTDPATCPYLYHPASVKLQPSYNPATTRERCPPNRHTILAIYEIVPIKRVAGGIGTTQPHSETSTRPRGAAAGKQGGSGPDDSEESEDEEWLPRSHQHSI
jgi:hypothetical protein